MDLNKRQRAANMDEYKALVKDALYEVDELKAAIEYDEEFMGDALSIVGKLDEQLKALAKNIEQGDYKFGGDDLPFMSLVSGSGDHVLPFKHLLLRINLTHKEGLAED